MLPKRPLLSASGAQRGPAAQNQQRSRSRALAVSAAQNIAKHSETTPHDAVAPILNSENEAMMYFDSSLCSRSYCSNAGPPAKTSPILAAPARRRPRDSQCWRASSQEIRCPCSEVARHGHGVEWLLGTAPQAACRHVYQMLQFKGGSILRRFLSSIYLCQCSCHGLRSLHAPVQKNLSPKHQARISERILGGLARPQLQGASIESLPCKATLFSGSFSSWKRLEGQVLQTTAATTRNPTSAQ